MFVFGHAGLTLAAARAVDRKIDPRWAVLLAWAPDLIDKPIRVLLPVFSNHNTRSLGHSAALSLVVFAALLLWKRRPKAALLLWACYAGHFLLDSMWLHPSPIVLCWPLLGDFPRPIRGPILSWLTAWNVAGELAGTFYLHRLGLFDASRLKTVLKTGRL